MAYERTWQPMAMQGPRAAVSSPDISSRHAWELAQMLLGRRGATQGIWTVWQSSDGIISTSAMTPNTLYSLTVVGVVDKANNPV